MRRGRETLPRHPLDANPGQSARHDAPVRRRGRCRDCCRTSDRYRPIEVVDLIGFEPGSCDIVLVVDCTSSPAFTLVRVCERLKVPPSCAWARVLELSTGPLPRLT